MPDVLIENELETETASQTIEAAARNLTDALSNSIDAGCPLEIAEVVALIKAIPPDPMTIHRRKTDRPQWKLQPCEAEMPFDEDEWNREWSQIEVEINRLAD